MTSILQFCKILFVTTFVVLTSCKKEDSIIIKKQFLEVIIDEEKIRIEVPFDSNITTNKNYRCNNKDIKSTEIRNSGGLGWEIKSELCFYSRKENFDSVKTGNFKLLDEFKTNTCNLDLSLNIVFHRIQGSDNFQLVSLPKHNVSSIEFIREDSTYLYFTVIGDFSGTYKPKNNIGKNRTIIGSYKQNLIINK